MRIWRRRLVGLLGERWFGEGVVSAVQCIDRKGGRSREAFKTKQCGQGVAAAAQQLESAAASECVSTLIVLPHISLPHLLSALQQPPSDLV